jgi:shikimate dehydrogenase
MENNSAKIFAVTGSPILHSRSPRIFNAAFESMGIDALYTRIGAASPEEAIACAKEMNLAGFNVTSPFKEGILPFLDDVDDRARIIGAVNTVVARDGKLKGYNTDPAGVVKALTASGINLSGSKAAVIGAGGAAKAALFGLLSEGAQVTLFNRTLHKAESLAERLGCRAAGLGALEEELEHMDILVSCLPRTEKIIDPSYLREGLVILDAVYSEETPLVSDGKEIGCRIIDGREWLLYQGVESFIHFTGLEPPVPVMRTALYAEEPAFRKNIALVGFMGTGKSTVAERLSRHTGMVMKDVDSEIEKKARVTIKEIFEAKGEDEFRRLESAEIDETVNLTNTIISCGGGAVLNRNNVDALRKNCIVAWLWADVETILKRVGGNGARPLLNRDDRESAIKRLLNERMPLYARCSDLIVRSEGAEPDEIARKVYEESRKFLDN